MENLNGLVLYQPEMARPAAGRARMHRYDCFIMMSQRKAISCQTFWHCATRGRRQPN
jgi:hypothetical protein